MSRREDSEKDKLVKIREFCNFTMVGKAVRLFNYKDLTIRDVLYLHYLGLELHFCEGLYAEELPTRTRIMIGNCKITEQGKDLLLSRVDSKVFSISSENANILFENIRVCLKLATTEKMALKGLLNLYNSSIITKQFQFSGSEVVRCLIKSTNVVLFEGSYYSTKFYDSTTVVVRPGVTMRGVYFLNCKDLCVEVPKEFKAKLEGVGTLYLKLSTLREVSRVKLQGFVTNVKFYGKKELLEVLLHNNPNFKFKNMNILDKSHYPSSHLRSLGLYN